MVKRQLSTGERRLKSVFETDDTAKCGIECIEKFFHFCPSSTYGSSGVCCADIASCEFKGILYGRKLQDSTIANPDIPTAVAADSSSDQAPGI